MTDKIYERWLTEVSEAFGLDDRAGVSPLRGGTSSVSFIVDAAERVIVSFCVDLTVERAERLVALLEHFEQHGFLTNRILRSKSGGPVHIVDGVPAIVKAFIDGKTVSVVDEAKAYRIGVVLAQLHKIPVPSGFAWDHSMNPEAMTGLAEDAEDPSFAAWISATVRALPKDWGELPTGIVHGDLGPDNLLEVQDGSLIPIDFEEARRYPLVFDIGMSVVGLANTHAFTLQTIASLLAGYESKRELRPSERELVPTMVECSSAMTACWRYDLGHDKKLSNHGELRDWRDMQVIHARSLEWRRSGVWSTLLGT